MPYEKGFLSIDSYMTQLKERKQEQCKIINLDNWTYGVSSVNNDNTVEYVYYHSGEDNSHEIAKLLEENGFKLV